jgi:lysophospholipase L1-like esterase
MTERPETAASSHRRPGAGRAGWIAVICLIVALAAPTIAAAQPAVLIVGDSWARLMYTTDALVEVLTANGHPEITVYGDSTTEDGTTAADWASPSRLQLLTDTLNAHPEIAAVVIFVGGNDLLAGQSGGGWYVGMDPAAEQALFDGIEQDTAAMIDHLLGLNPALKIALSSYDYPNFVETLQLPAAFLCVPLWQDLGEPTPLQINGHARILDQGRTVIAASRPQVTPVTSWGLMQYLYGYPSMGIPPGALPPPGDPSLPSPPESLRLGIDCFHLAPAGYAAIAERLWRFALGPEFDGIFADGFESGDLSAWSASP